MKPFALFASLSLLLPLLGGCTGYKSQEVPFRPPSAYPGMQSADGAQVAAEGYADQKRAKEVFGFDIRKAGLLPVQVVIDNRGSSTLEVVPDQTFLIDAAGNYWNLLDRHTAYQRVEGSSEYARIAKGSGGTALLGAAGGAVLGAAIGILTGQSVGESLGKGAAVGAAGGALIGGVGSATSGDEPRQISKDLANKNLENRAIKPGILGRGFLFYPGEAPSASQLRLQLRDVDSGKLYNVMLAL
jgi:hypothetical protein